MIRISANVRTFSTSTVSWQNVAYSFVSMPLVLPEYSKNTLKNTMKYAVVVHERDCLVVLPIGFGKYPIYHLLSVPLSDTILLLE